MGRLRELKTPPELNTEGLWARNCMWQKVARLLLVFTVSN